jgi:hypothetical protein
MSMDDYPWPSPVTEYRHIEVNDVHPLLRHINGSGFGPIRELHIPFPESKRVLKLRPELAHRARLNAEVAEAMAELPLARDRRDYARGIEVINIELFKGGCGIVNPPWAKEFGSSYICPILLHYNSNPAGLDGPMFHVEFHAPNTGLAYAPKRLAGPPIRSVVPAGIAMVDADPADTNIFFHQIVYEMLDAAGLDPPLPHLYRPDLVHLQLAPRMFKPIVTPWPSFTFASNDIATSWAAAEGWQAASGSYSPGKDYEPGWWAADESSEHRYQTELYFASLFSPAAARDALHRLGLNPAKKAVYFRWHCLCLLVEGATRLRSDGFLEAALPLRLPSTKLDDPCGLTVESESSVWVPLFTAHARRGMLSSGPSVSQRLFHMHTVVLSSILSTGFYPPTHGEQEVFLRREPDAESASPLSGPPKNETTHVHTVRPARAGKPAVKLVGRSDDRLLITSADAEFEGPYLGHGRAAVRRFSLAVADAAKIQALLRLPAYRRLISSEQRARDITLLSILDASIRIVQDPVSSFFPLSQFEALRKHAREGLASDAANGIDPATRYKKTDAPEAQSDGVSPPGPTRAASSSHDVDDQTASSAPAAPALPEEKVADPHASASDAALVDVRSVAADSGAAAAGASEHVRTRRASVPALPSQAPPPLEVDAAASPATSEPHGLPMLAAAPPPGDEAYIELTREFERQDGSAHC